MKTTLCFLLFLFSVVAEQELLTVDPIIEDQQTGGADAQTNEPWYGSLPDTYTDNGMVFHLADLTTSVRLANGYEGHLEAFATMDNDGFYNRHQNQINPDYEQSEPSVGAGRASRFHWVSIGVPTIVRSIKALPSGATTSNILEAGSDEFVMQVQMLTEQQRLVLARKASQKYGLRVAADQISHLVLEIFACQLNITDTDSRRFSFVGTVRDFRNFPLLVHFPVPQGSDRWDLLQARANDSSLHFHCMLQQPSGRTLRTNTLSITQSDVQNSKLLPRLFGQRERVYVTREQMQQFATDLVSSMRVVEEYNMRGVDAFGEDFVRELVKNHVVSEFGNRPFAEALDQLAAYKLYEGRRVASLNASVAILRDLLVVDRNSSVVTLNSRLRCFNQSVFDVSLAACELRPLKFLGVQDTAQLVTRLRNTWLHARLPVEDQLAELNEHPESSIGWDFADGNIVPLSLNVTLVTRSSLAKPRTFARIRRQYYDAAYTRSLTLYARRAVASSTDSPSETSSVPIQTQIDLTILLQQTQDAIVRQVASQIAKIDLTARPVRLAAEDLETVAQDVQTRLYRSIYVPLEYKLNTLFLSNSSTRQITPASSQSACPANSDRQLQELANKLEMLSKAQRTLNATPVGLEVRRISQSVERIADELRTLRGLLANSPSQNITVSRAALRESPASVAAVGELAFGERNSKSAGADPNDSVEVITVDLVDFKKHPSLCLRGYTSVRTSESSPYECASKCHRQKDCTSFSYYANTTECELKNALSLHSFRSKARPYEGCSFYYATCNVATHTVSVNGTFMTINANTGLNYSAASSYCSQKRQHLFEPRTLAENKMLVTTMRSVRLGSISNYFWINAERATTDRRGFMWFSDKTDIATYFWAAAQPDNSVLVNNNCLVMELGKGVSGGWYTENCNTDPSLLRKRKFGTVCQCNDYGAVVSI